MSEPPVLPSRICESCGVSIPPQAPACWLCRGGNPYASLPPGERQQIDKTISQSERRVQGICLALLGGLVVLAIFIGIGLAVQDLGMLIPYSIVVGPAFLATMVQAAYGYSGNRTVKPSSLVLTMIGSVAITVGLMAILALAAFAALFVMCFSGQMF